MKCINASNHQETNGLVEMSQQQKPNNEILWRILFPQSSWTEFITLLTQQYDDHP